MATTWSARPAVVGSAVSAPDWRAGSDPANTMRLIFVISCLLPGPQFLIYIVLWILMPSER